MKYFFNYFLMIVSTVCCIHGMEQIDYAQLRKDVEKYEQDNQEKQRILKYSEKEYAGTKCFYDLQLERAFKEGNGERVVQLLNANNKLAPYLRYLIQGQEKRAAWARNLVKYNEQQNLNEKKKALQAKL